MVLLQRWMAVFAIGGVLFLLRLWCQKRRLPPPPFRLPLAAALTWALAASLPLGALPASHRLWLSLADDLLVAFAALRLILWAALELPAGLGWWRKPPALLVQLLTLGGSALAAVVILRQEARLDLISLITTSAVLTAVVGLASQEALKDLISGLELQLSDDFCVGDWIELASGQHGIVTSITWRDCSLRTFDDHLLVVPNSKITTDVLNNRSHFGRSSQRIKVGLDYDFPPARAQHLLMEVVAGHPDVLQDPAPRVRLASFDDSAITYEIQVWNRSPSVSQIDLRSALLCQLWYALRREGQTIPFPVRQVEPRRQPPLEDFDVPGSPERSSQELAGSVLFADLHEEQRLALVECSQHQWFGPGERIVEEGAEGNSLYVVLSGRVEVSKNVEGRSRVLSVLGPREIFGEMTLLLDAPRTATVCALRECHLLKVARPAVQALIEDDPDLLGRFAALMAARQAQINNLSLEQEQEQGHGFLAAMKRLFAAMAGS